MSRPSFPDRAVWQTSVCADTSAPRKSHRRIRYSGCFLFWYVCCWCGRGICGGRSGMLWFVGWSSSLEASGPSFCWSSSCAQHEGTKDLGIFLGQGGLGSCSRLVPALFALGNLDTTSARSPYDLLGPFLAAVCGHFSHSVRVDVSAFFFSALDGEEFFVIDGSGWRTPGV